MNQLPLQLAVGWPAHTPAAALAAASSWHVNCLKCATSSSKLCFTLVQDTLSCSSWPTSPGLRWEKRWVDLRLIPLLHSRLSQHMPGSDVCRWAVGLHLEGSVASVRTHWTGFSQWDSTGCRCWDRLPFYCLQIWADCHAPSVKICFFCYLVYPFKYNLKNKSVLQ